MTQYGCNWDFLYIVKLEYIDKDTKESPESSFIFAKNIEQWKFREYTDYCPALGKRECYQCC
ncbi:DUF1561 family protein [Bartonella bacilliformis]|uniref:Uncharacterized protein n=2 Tax=Bartonella bacilliformis TaxID=774 RepID=A0ABN0IGB3_BARBA|nr:hypothetical protein BbINS_04190 [Bartonella bacilliformis INS]KZN21414.1 hypothetical protein A6B38_05815 [Bartonella bacilliformis]